MYVYVYVFVPTDYTSHHITGFVLFKLPTAFSASPLMTHPHPHTTPCSGGRVKKRTSFSLFLFCSGHKHD